MKVRNVKFKVWCNRHALFFLEYPLIMTYNYITGYANEDNVIFVTKLRHKFISTSDFLETPTPLYSGKLYSYCIDYWYFFVLEIPITILQMSNTENNLFPDGDILSSQSKY